MARKQQEDLIFWDEKNQHSVKITPSGHIICDGIEEILTRKEALIFLRNEKRDAEKFYVEAGDERKTNIIKFISKVNTALARMRSW